MYHGMDIHNRCFKPVGNGIDGIIVYEVCEKCSVRENKRKLISEVTRI